MRYLCASLIVAALGCGNTERSTPLPPAEPAKPAPEPAPTPAPAPAVALAAPWSLIVTSQLFGVVAGPLDRIDLDSTGAMHHHSSELDFGTWRVPADALAPIATQLGSAEVGKLHDVEAHGEGYVYGLAWQSPAGDHKLDLAGELPPAVAPIYKALNDQLSAHNRAELAALGPFSVELTASFAYADQTKPETIVVDQTGVARQLRGGTEVAHRDVSPERLAYIATLVRLPALAATTAQPAVDHPVKLVISRGAKRQTIATDLRSMPLAMSFLYNELYSEQAAFPH